MSDLSKQIAFKNLLKFKEILDYLNIPFWLDGGTLLGAYRDTGFCEDDEDDIDLGMWNDDVEFNNNKVDLINIAIQAGFKIYHEWKYQIAFKKEGFKIDLFLHREIENDAVHLLYGKSIDSDKTEKWGGVVYKYIPAVVPAYFFKNFKVIVFKGHAFLMPDRVEEYLTLKYGDWRTPVNRKEYNQNHGCYDPKYNKVLRPDYNI